MQTISFTEKISLDYKILKIKNNQIENLDFLLDLEEKSPRIYTKSLLSYLPYNVIEWIMTLDDHPMLKNKVTRGVINMSLENMRRNNVEDWIKFDFKLSKRSLEMEEQLLDIYKNEYRKMDFDFELNFDEFKNKPHMNYIGGFELTKYLFGIKSNETNFKIINPNLSSKLDDIECIYYQNEQLYITRRWLRVMETNYIFLNKYELEKKIKNQPFNLIRKLNDYLELGIGISIVDSNLIYKKYEKSDKNFKIINLINDHTSLLNSLNQIIDAVFK